LLDLLPHRRDAGARTPRRPSSNTNRIRNAPPRRIEDRFEGLLGCRDPTTGASSVSRQVGFADEPELRSCYGEHASNAAIDITATVSTSEEQ